MVAPSPPACPCPGRAPWWPRVTPGGRRSGREDEGGPTEVWSPERPAGVGRVARRPPLFAGPPGETPLHVQVAHALHDLAPGGGRLTSTRKGGTAALRGHPIAVTKWRRHNTGSLAHATRCWRCGRGSGWSRARGGWPGSTGASRQGCTASRSPPRANRVASWRVKSLCRARIQRVLPPSTCQLRNSETTDWRSGSGDGRGSGEASLPLPPPPPRCGCGTLPPRSERARSKT